MPETVTPDRTDNVLPVIALPSVLVFPGLVAPLLGDKPESIAAIQSAAAENLPLALFWARESLDLDHLVEIGVSARIVRLLRLPTEQVQVLVQGIARVRRVDVVAREPVPRLLVEPVQIPKVPLAGNPLREAVINSFRAVVALSSTLPDEAAIVAANATDAGELADIVAGGLELPAEDRQRVLEEIDPIPRLEMVLRFSEQKRKYLEVSRQIQQQVGEQSEKTQRDYLLRQQLRQIQRELGELDPQQAEAAELRRLADAAQLPPEVRAEVDGELARLERLNPAAPEYAIVRTRLDWILSLPWASPPPPDIDLERAQAVLDADHYGLQKVKERIIEYLAVAKLAGSARGPILCLVGPPGVGKTSLGRSIARALNRPFVRASLGGVRDEAEIRGHRRTYVGAMPGRIIQGMRSAGAKNPVFMLDEVDKLAVGFQGDPAAALLEVLDPAQNHAFTDHYLDLPYDLSSVFFICTANLVDPIPAALRDRMEIIEMSGYTAQEKTQIARHHLLPRQMREHGLPADGIRMSDEVLMAIIRGWTREAGVRQLERQLAAICRKVARRRASGDDRPVEVTAQLLEEWLGPRPVAESYIDEPESVGAATGLAWTPVGGDVLTVEAAVVSGSGNLTLTGQLGSVMQESARAAITYARLRSEELGLPQDFFQKHDIHIHVPAGAIPKDGPSAGITLATALISAATRRAVDRYTAMTGEITLRGLVLPIGGVKEKLLAAHQAGVRAVILPRRNQKDLVEVPQEVLQQLEIVPVDNMDQVLARALKQAPERMLELVRSA